MVDNQRQRKARVFISCGQTKGTDEPQIAHDVAEKLIGLGFLPYIAVEEQTLNGLTDNIFRQLRESEYLVFIDFKREELVDSVSKGNQSVYRGSLFSNQELAIAAFIDINNVLAFQESGVKKEDGILKFIQAQCFPFIDRHSLADVIAQKVTDKLKKGIWDSHWRNELLLERKKSEYDDVINMDTNRMARYFHIRVHNLHREKIAYNCTAYLKVAENPVTKNTIEPDIVEYKWKGLTIPAVAILPKGHRDFDAFYVYHDSPNLVYLGVNKFIVDYSGYHFAMEGPNEYNLTYVVCSDNLPPVESKFRLHVGQKLDDIQFYELAGNE